MDEVLTSYTLTSNLVQTRENIDTTLVENEISHKGQEKVVEQ